MSSTLVTPGPTPTHGSGNENGGNGGGIAGGAGPNNSISTPSSLYLITFAVTLSLLLSVSCAILTRNVVLRARERRLRAAIAAGVVVPDELAQQHGIRQTGFHARQFGERPVLWDVWMPSEEKMKTDWATLRPVSVVPLLASTTDSGSARATTPVARPVHRTLFERALQLPPLPRLPASSSAPAAAPPTTQPTSAITDLESQPGVRVAVLVAMPTQQRRSTHARNPDDEPLPEVVLGTSDVVWNSGAPKS
ncbi:hypothetical protein EXIGLDRAFT_744204 [Exidia glandulosa HHB12029]|uniref:Uncharacterized protein n=1 Tax=Exidia glandulosa HHB12029 TaxID=1314781 RepID=A0A165Q2K3_EXIGL|nr:hypothetical protein EXIGLDRAFT_744204 [Exidia glandulosa HHB12029]